MRRSGRSDRLPSAVWAHPADRARHRAGCECPPHAAPAPPPPEAARVRRHGSLLLELRPASIRIPRAAQRRLRPHLSHLRAKHRAAIATRINRQSTITPASPQIDGEREDGSARTAPTIWRACGASRQPGVRAREHRAHRLRPRRRRLGRQLAGQTGLNHVEPGVTRRHYNLHAYRGEKRAAFETWARYLEAIPANKQPATGTVVPFRR